MGASSFSANCCSPCHRTAPETAEHNFGGQAPIAPVGGHGTVENHGITLQIEGMSPQQGSASPIDSARSDWARSSAAKVEETPPKTVCKEIARGSEKSELTKKGFYQLLRSESRDELLFAREWDIAKQVVSKLEESGRETFDLKMSARGTLQCSHSPEASEGLALQFPITFSEAEVLRSHLVRYGSSKPIHYRSATSLIERFQESHQELRPSPLVYVDVPRSKTEGKAGRLIVVGDTHGQLQDVLFILQEYGPPTAENVYLFNGDIADRGPNACEIYFLLFAYFLADPASVYINRGNHEDEDMNAQDEEYGGGFRDEAARKYGPTTYWQFVEMMKMLPLATVIGKKVFVVHGGLSKYELTLNDIANIDHTSCTIPDYGTEKPEEQVWIDLLWADPMDYPGIRESGRGVGALFGPDVTEKFCINNSPIEFIIRSHQLPDDQKGYMYQKGKRCITIFSASNYCGDSGNQGAVLIFDSETFPQYAVFDHFAPDLDALAGLMHSCPQKWRDAGKALKEHQRKRQQDSWNRRELNKMLVAIVEMKPHIWSAFLDTTGGVPLISYETWMNILSGCIGQTWNWEAAWEAWNGGDRANGVINFRDFLQRFRVVVSNESFKFKMITTVYESIMHSHQSLEETLRLFDQDNDGMVDMKEMREVLRSIDIGLTRQQIDSLLHTLFECPADTRNLPRLATSEFLGRFTMVFKSAEGALAEKHLTQDQRIAHEALGKIGLHVAAMPYEKLGIKPPDLTMARVSSNVDFASVSSGMSATLSQKLADQRSPGQKEVSKVASLKNTKTAATADTGIHVAAKLRSLFEVLDEDGNGVLSYEEFVRGMMRIPGISDIELSNGERISEDRIRALAKVVDRVNGGISILELLEALCFEDTGAGGGSLMTDSLAEHILTVLFRHRSAVRAGARCFDRSGIGVVKKEEFERVLHALNDVTSGSGTPLLGPQIFRLCESLSEEAQKGIAQIDYEEFFDSFEVVDEDTSTTVKLGKRKRKSA